MLAAAAALFGLHEGCTHVEMHSHVNGIYLCGHHSCEGELSGFCGLWLA